MKKILVTLSIAATAALAHTPVMSCFDNMDGTITCEAGFSDGSSASGVTFELQQSGETVAKKKFDDFSEVVFDKPNGTYTAIMNAGEGHLVKVRGDDIF
ncbi:MAG: hypothetical protein ACQESH_07315 [Campylobacterota bacterium]